MDLDSQAKQVQSFLDNGNYHAAFNVALSALNACRRNDDQAGVDRFLGLIRSVVDALVLAVGGEGDKAGGKDA
jgi:hypothetical protein